jgi:fido (protein-threonine AMPylation protein)
MPASISFSAHPYTYCSPSPGPSPFGLTITTILSTYPEKDYTLIKAGFSKLPAGDGKEYPMNLLNRLREERRMRLKGGIYHFTQIKFCYNSNRIEGSRLTEEQTRYIYETNTINTETGKAANVDDIIEARNHFACFSYILDIAEEQLSEDNIKEIHRIFKSSTSDSEKDWFRVGGYKAMPNIIGDRETTPPDKVQGAVQRLLFEYSQKDTLSLEDIIRFHHDFENIHPFQDGNGRIGRLILFKECLKHDVIPFIIDEEHKNYYYRGLRGFKDTPGYLIDTCLSVQDRYKEHLAYFHPDQDMLAKEQNKRPSVDNNMSR